MVQTVAVIGAGTMGNGIAHVFAQNGFAVRLIDNNSDQLEKALKTISRNLDRQVEKRIIDTDAKTATLANISTSIDLAGGLNQTDFVIEAATENPEVKKSLFRQIDEYAPQKAILATNTSSISITSIAAVTHRAGQVIGMHFMNPVPVMKLVEIINGHATTKQTTEEVVRLTTQIGKLPCIVNDFPGFIANRILMPMINEAIFALYEHVADVASIDTIMKTGMAHPMGPLQLADFIGLDVCLSILEVMHTGFGNPKYAPCPLLRNMVAAGDLGLKSGIGFYTYASGVTPVVSERFKYSG